ncbi:glycoside hydrolase family 1 protein [Candidatus Parcubacteria bacterium]|nr:glycoside hydrolase family 1 protein [Candidatus Parcubacteria bacterium]
MVKVLRFPKWFLWGSSTSAYQVEGGIENCDWGSRAGKACDYYNRYEQDFDWLEKFNQNAYRFSIEWSRIEPKPGKFNQKEIEHYRKVLLALKERNIKSIVTLWHWTNPIWFIKMGGWADKKAVKHFENYTKVIVKELGDLINLWVTLNEPMVYISGYSTGRFPPFQKRNILKFRKVFNNLVKAHKIAYQSIHAQYPNAQVSISKLTNYFEPARKWCVLEIFFAWLGHIFWNHLFLKRIKSQLDYIGFDYYFHHRIVWYPPFIRNFKKETTDMGWEIYPKGIYYALKYLNQFKKPIYILENGLADAQDKQRKDFIKDHLFWVHKAIEEGIDVRGYFHWSLMDNLEWNKGFEPRFGLIEIDYKTMKRKPRPSAYYYAKICRNNYIEI